MSSEQNGACRSDRHAPIDKLRAVSTVERLRCVTLPDSSHNKARELAKRDNISINQMIATGLAENISALTTEEYLEERAARGNRRKFRKAMTKSPKRAPMPEDEL